MEFIIACNWIAGQDLLSTPFKEISADLELFKESESLKHTISELFLIDRLDCSYIGYFSYFGSGGTRLGYIFWWC
jgi:hypothetical protein